MQSFMNALGKFFGVFLRGQTYLNALYLFMAFPLGLFYFVFLVVGISVGLPLVIVWVGLLVLLLVIGLWYACIVFERQMAISMLREDIPPITRQDLSGKTLWQKFTAMMGNSVTWKGLLYLLAKFPLGIIDFVILVTFLSVSVAFIGAPFYFAYWSPSVDLTLIGEPWTNVILIDTLPEALLFSLVGLFILLVSMHIFNGLAWVQGKFARVMLGSFAPAPVSAVAAISAAPAPVAPIAPVEAVPATAAPETPANASTDSSAPAEQPSAETQSPAE